MVQADAGKAAQSMESESIQVDVALQLGNLGVITNPIPAVTWTRWFDTWLAALQPQLSPIGAYELSLRLTDDAEIQALNYQYRHKNQPTDVLAFAALEVAQPHLDMIQANHPLYLGDIVISINTAHAQAESGLRRELAWLAAHGLLHLLGWDHPNEAQLTAMLDQQTRLLKAVQLDWS